VTARLSDAIGTPPRFVTSLDPTAGAHLGPDALVLGAVSGRVDL
jgi:hypothetical protein